MSFSYAVKRVLPVILATNMSSFLTVGMEKHITGYSKEQAAVVNALSAVPILYDIGFDIGHEIFYDDQNFMQTAENQLRHRNLFHRPYLNL
jgi:hypothetical protein